MKEFASKTAALPKCNGHLFLKGPNLLTQQRLKTCTGKKKKIRLFPALFIFKRKVRISEAVPATTVHSPWHENTSTSITPPKNSPASCQESTFLFQKSPKAPEEVIGQLRSFFVPYKISGLGQTTPRSADRAGNQQRWAGVGGRVTPSDHGRKRARESETQSWRSAEREVHRS